MVEVALVVVEETAVVVNVLSLFPRLSSTLVDVPGCSVFYLLQDQYNKIYAGAGPLPCLFAWIQSVLMIYHDSYTQGLVKNAQKSKTQLELEVKIGKTSETVAICCRWFGGAPLLLDFGFTSKEATVIGKTEDMCR